MTREHRLVLSLDEIHAVRWTCPRCHVAITFRLDELVALPTDCPTCRDPLLGDHDERGMQTLQDFVRALKAAQKAPAWLSLEVDDTEPSPRR